MNSSDLFQENFSGSQLQQPEHGRTQPAIRVKELSERDRRRLLMHFLGLGDSDRSLRFGIMLPDESITRYVQRLDFSRDAIFGVFDADLTLAGVGHLAFVPCDTKPRLNAATEKQRIAEFGVSVSANPERERKNLDALIELIEVKSFDVRAARSYGPVRKATSERKSDHLDKLIAAHAIALGATLVTNDEGDFAAYPALTIENWVKL